MISLRREVQESELTEARFVALLAAFRGVATAVAQTALPANPELAEDCARVMAHVTKTLDTRPPSKTIEDAGKATVQQIEQIRGSNQAALEQRDTAIKEVVSMVAGAVSSLKGKGETHKTDFSNLADEFDALSHIEDAAELRRKLKNGVDHLRQSVETMRRDNERSVQQFESQMSEFQQRLEKARKDSECDRLTGLGSRQEASRHFRSVANSNRAVCFQLFDIEGFKEINKQHGTLFGDQLLKALAQVLRSELSGAGSLFRWAGDEFLVITEGLLPACTMQGEEIRRSFAGGRYVTVKDGAKVTLTADVAFGAAQYKPGESLEEVYARARQSLEQSRIRWWRQ